MKALINENNVVTTLLRAGYIDGAIDVTADVPEDFEPYKYKYVDGVFIENLTPATPSYVNYGVLI